MKCPIIIIFCSIVNCFLSEVYCNANPLLRFLDDYFGDTLISFPKSENEVLELPSTIMSYDTVAKYLLQVKNDIPCVRDHIPKFYYAKGSFYYEGIRYLIYYSTDLYQDTNEIYLCAWNDDKSFPITLKLFKAHSDGMEREIFFRYQNDCLSIFNLIEKDGEWGINTDVYTLKPDFSFHYGYLIIGEEIRFR